MFPLCKLYRKQLSLPKQLPEFCLFQFIFLIEKLCHGQIIDHFRFLFKELTKADRLTLIRRSSFVKTQIIPRESGDFSVIMSLDDEAGNLMTLELMAPDSRQAVRLSKLFEKKAEAVYNLTMTELLDDEEEIEE